MSLLGGSLQIVNAPKNRLFLFACRGGSMIFEYILDCLLFFLSMHFFWDSHVYIAISIYVFTYINIFISHRLFKPSNAFLGVYVVSWIFWGRILRLSSSYEGSFWKNHPYDLGKMKKPELTGDTSCDKMGGQNKSPTTSQKIWVFPKIGGTPKWMVYKWKTLLKRMIWGYPYFWKPPFILRFRSLNSTTSKYTGTPQVPCHPVDWHPLGGSQHPYIYIYIYM